MSGPQGHITIYLERGEGTSKVRHMTIGTATCFSVQDMVKATCKGCKWGGGSAGAPPQGIREAWMRHARTGGQDESSWEGALCFLAVFPRDVGVAGSQEEWAPLAGVGAIMWGLVSSGTAPPDNGKVWWQDRICKVIQQVSENGTKIMAPQDVCSCSAKKPRIALMDSKDDPSSHQVKEKWKCALQVVAGVTGVDTVQDSKERSKTLGRTLNKLMQGDPWARDEALKCEEGLMGRARAMMLRDGEEACVKMLHAVKTIFMCSWAHLLYAAGFMMPTLALFGSTLSASQLTGRVKELVHCRKQMAKLVRTTSGATGPIGGKEVPGVYMDPHTRFEFLMSCPSIRATLRMPLGQLLICLSFDERTLAKVWWGNTLVGLKFAAGPNHSRKDDYHNILLYDGKEAAELLAIHGEVVAAPISICWGLGCFP